MNLPPGDPGRKYIKLSKYRNCDGKVVQALQAGGLETYAKTPGTVGYRGSASLLGWLQDAVPKIKKWNACQLKVEGWFSVSPSQELKGVVPEAEDWKKKASQHARSRGEEFC